MKRSRPEPTVLRKIPGLNFALTKQAPRFGEPVAESKPWPKWPVRPYGLGIVIFLVTVLFSPSASVTVSVS
jgi:hypothetical protein